MKADSKPTRREEMTHSSGKGEQQQPWIKLEQLLENSPDIGATNRQNARKYRTISPARQSLQAEVSEIWDYRELVQNLAWRDLTTRYRQTALGISWALIQPLLLMIVACACFGRMMHNSASDVPYPVFVYAGLLPWQYFSSAVTRASNSVLSVGGLMKKVYFPRVIAPIASVIPPLVDLFVAFILVLGLMVLYHVPFQAHMLFAPLFVVLASELALGLGLWAAALHVKYRDICHIVPFFLQLAMFASPVFYSTNAIPERLRSFYFLNPLFGIIDGFRWSITGTGIPDSRSIMVSIVVATILLVTGGAYFKFTEDQFADYV